MAAQSAGLRGLWGRAQAAGGRRGPGARCCPGYAEARVQSRKRLWEAAQRAQPEETQAGLLGSGLAGPWSHCLSSCPGAGPAGFCCFPCCCCYSRPRSWARARSTPRRLTGFACLANAKVRGRGPRTYSAGEVGLAEKSLRVQGPRLLSETPLNLLCAWLYEGRWAGERPGLGAPRVHKEVKTSSYHQG